MIIKRENDNDEIEYIFRILDTSKINYNSIKIFLDDKFKYSIYEKENGNVNILIEIEKIENSIDLIELVSEYSLSQIDIYISLISSYDQGGITVPDYITFILKNISCELNFSYVIC